MLRGFSVADLAGLYDISEGFEDELRDECVYEYGARFFYGLAGLNKNGEEGADSDDEDEDESEGEEMEVEEENENEYYYYGGVDDEFESSNFICEDSSEDEYDEGECDGDSGDEVENDEDSEEDADDED